MVAGMDYVQMGFTWFLFLASLVAWVATSSKSDDKLWFWLVLAAGWACFGALVTLVVTDTMAVSDWKITALRIGGYSFLALGMVYAIWSLSEERFF